MGGAAIYGSNLYEYDYDSIEPYLSDFHGMYYDTGDSHSYVGIQNVYAAGQAFPSENTNTPKPSLVLGQLGPLHRGLDWSSVKDDISSIQSSLLVSKFLTTTGRGVSYYVPGSPNTIVYKDEESAFEYGTKGAWINSENINEVSFSNMQFDKEEIRPTDIFLNARYRKEDCMHIREIINQIPVLKFHYDDTMILDQCMSGQWILMPSFLVHKLKPFYGVYRPYILRSPSSYLYYATPVLRKIEQDRNIDDDSDYQLMEKKKYYQEKSREIYLNRDTVSFFSKKLFDTYAHLPKEDNQLYMGIIEKIVEKNKDKINIEKAVRLCPKVEDALFLDDGDDYWEQHEISTPVIQTRAHKDSTALKHNYCFSPFKSNWVKAGTAALWFSAIFLDPAAEILAGAACASTGVGVIGAGACARGALALKAATEVYYLQKLEKSRSWPGKELT